MVLFLFVLQAVLVSDSNNTACKRAAAHIADDFFNVFPDNFVEAGEIWIQRLR